MVSNAPSRGHSWMISVSAADRNAPATRAAAPVAGRRVGGDQPSPGPQARHQRGQPARRLVVLQAAHVFDHQRGQAHRGRAAARPPRCATSSARCCLWARRRARSAIGRVSGSTSTSTRPAVRDGVAQPRRPDHHDRRAPFRPAQHRRQRRGAAERAGEQGSLDAHLPSSGRKPIMSEPTSMSVLRSARAGGAARQDRRQGPLAAAPRGRGLARTEGDRRDDRSAGVAASGRPAPADDARRAGRPDDRRRRGTRAGGRALAGGIRVHAGARGRHAGARTRRALRGPFIGVDRRPGGGAGGRPVPVADRRRPRRGAGGRAFGARLGPLPRRGRLSRAARAGHRPRSASRC